MKRRTLKRPARRLARLEAGKVGLVAGRWDCLVGRGQGHRRLVRRAAGGVLRVTGTSPEASVRSPPFVGRRDSPLMGTVSSRRSATPRGPGHRASHCGRVAGKAADSANPRGGPGSETAGTDDGESGSGRPSGRECLVGAGGRAALVVSALRTDGDCSGEEAWRVHPPSVDRGSDGVPAVGDGLVTAARVGTRLRARRDSICVRFRAFSTALERGDERGWTASCPRRSSRPWGRPYRASATRWSMLWKALLWPACPHWVLVPRAVPGGSGEGVECGELGFRTLSRGTVRWMNAVSRASPRRSRPKRLGRPDSREGLRAILSSD